MLCKYCNSEMILDFRHEKYSNNDPFEEGHSCPKCKAKRFYSELDWDMERWINKNGEVEFVDLESGYVEDV